MNSEATIFLARQLYLHKVLWSQASKSHLKFLYPGFWLTIYPIQQTHLNDHSKDFSGYGWTSQISQPYVRQVMDQKLVCENQIWLVWFYKFTPVWFKKDNNSIKMTVMSILIW